MQSQSSLLSASEKVGEIVDMQKTRGKEQRIKRQKIFRRQRQQFLRSLIASQQHDPLSYQTPEMGLEGLVATIRSKKKLQAALCKQSNEKRNYVQ